LLTVLRITVHPGFEHSMGMLISGGNIVVP